MVIISLYTSGVYVLFLNSAYIMFLAVHHVMIVRGKKKMYIFYSFPTEEIACELLISIIFCRDKDICLSPHRHVDTVVYHVPFTA